MQPICDDFFKEVDEVVDPAPELISECVRAYVAASRDYLLRLHDEHTPSSLVNNQHADLMDRLIRKLFRITEDRYFRHFPRLDVRFAIVTVGGYGRREQLPPYERPLPRATLVRKRRRRRGIGEVDGGRQV